MRKIKELVEKAKSRATTQSIAHTSAKHHGRGNSVDSRGPSPHTSGALLSASSLTLSAVFTIELPDETSRASSPSVHGGGRDTNSVVTALQDSRSTR
jgi:hypothetical protein